MSWSVSYPNGVRLDNLVDDLENGVQTGQTDLPEALDQAEVAKASAFALIASGVVGEAEVYNVNLSGHATAEMKPADGFAHPSVSVSVSMKEPFKEQEQTNDAG